MPFIPGHLFSGKCTLAHKRTSLRLYPAYNRETELLSRVRRRGDNLRVYEWKIGLSLTLLVMILMRLVWMDLRSYVIDFGPQRHHVFEQSDQLESCARSFEQKLPRSLKERSLEGSHQRPGWTDAWVYHAMLELSCKGGVFNVSGFVRYNQGLLITSLLALMLLTRILTHSWIIALISGVALLSRGRLIASLGQIGAEHLISMGLVVWGLSLLHWLRSGSWTMLSIHYLSLVWLIPLEPGMCFLALVLPLLLAICQRYGWENLARSQRAPSSLSAWWPWRDLIAAQSLVDKPRVPSGGLLRPVPGGVAGLWIDPDFVRRAWQFALGGGALLVSELFILTLLRSDPLLPRSQEWSALDLGQWFVRLLAPIDRDLGLALFAMVLVLALRTPWLLGLRTLILATACGLAGNILGSLVGDFLFLPGEAHDSFMSSRLLLWWEPLLLCLGLLALYQLILALLPRYAPYVFKSLPKP